MVLLQIEQYVTRSLTSRMASHSRSASSRGVLQDVERQALRALGADARKLLELIDETGEGFRIGHGMRLEIG